MSEDDRASRLRNRRQRTKDKATGETPSETDSTSETSERGEPDKPSKLDESSNPGEQGELDEASNADEMDEADEEGSVKDEQVGTYMYLPHRQKKELERTYNLLKAEYEFEYDEEFEKNRHFFPLVVRHGLETLENADASDIPELLETV